MKLVWNLIRGHVSVATALLVFMVVGCSSLNQSPANSNQQPQTVDPAGTRTIQHAMGTTRITGTPQRIVVLTNEATDSILALGVTPVGAVQSWAGDPYYDYIEAELVEVPTVGDELQPSLERIVSLQPDLIIGSKVRQQQVYEQLSAIAPTVFSETIGATWKDNFRLYAEALNREAEAEAVLEKWEQRVADFRAKMGDRLTQEVSLVRFLPDAVRVYYKDSFPGQVLADVGLSRPTSQDKNGFADEISIEQIASVEGDILFYFTFANGDRSEIDKATAVEQQWLNHPLWQNLEVVQSDNAYAVSDVIWTTAGGVQAANLLLDDLYTYFEIAPN
jgi:iron complex transport system substrate-binding protein